MVIKFNTKLTRLINSLLLIGTLSACNTMPQTYEFTMPTIDQTTLNSVSWPPAPQEARIMYLGDLKGESNKIEVPQERKSLSSRFFSALVGLGERYEPIIDVLRPQHGAVDGKGRIYVTDPGHQALFVFNEFTGEFDLWNEAKLQIPFIAPIGITLSDTSVFVADSEQGLVFELSTEGSILNTIGENQLTRPTGIAYDSQTQQLYVSDTSTNQIKVFSKAGNLLNTIGKLGDNPGEFNRPTFIVFKNQKLYVADSLNARIQVIDLVNNEIKIIGQRGLYVGNFTRPKGIDVDSTGNIYVIESYYDHLLIFNDDGEFLLPIGGSGNKAGQFAQPTGIWIDDDDRVFVSDMLNSRISIFQYLGDD